MSGALCIRGLEDGRFLVATEDGEVAVWKHEEQLEVVRTHSGDVRWADARPGKPAEIASVGRGIPGMNGDLKWSVTRVTGARVGARQEVICDDEACAWWMVDGPHNRLAGMYRRPAQIPEQIGRFLGFPAEVDICHTRAARHQALGFSQSHMGAWPGPPICVWYAPRPEFAHHDNWVGMHHGEALCEVLAGASQP